MRALCEGRPLGVQVKSAQDGIDGLRARLACDEADTERRWADHWPRARLLPRPSWVALRKAEGELQRLHAEALQEREQPADAVVAAMEANGRFDELLEAIHRRMRARAEPAAAPPAPIDVGAAEGA